MMMIKDDIIDKWLGGIAIIQFNLEEVTVVEYRKPPKTQSIY